jgi:diaminopropionate ammonia-lyase
MAGYTQIFEESYGQWDSPPDVILVPGGVGGLACAAASWAAWRLGPARPFLVACEPDAAACLLESARAGRPISLPGDLPTMMAGLRCAEPSPAAWPTIAAGVDAFLSVPDTLALDAVNRLSLETPPMRAGPSGACSTAALFALAQAPELGLLRQTIHMDRTTCALIAVTEGP